MSVENLLTSLNITIPESPKPVGSYVAHKKIGNLVFVRSYYTMPVTSDSTAHLISGLPFAVKASGWAYCATRCGGVSDQVVVQLNAGASNGDFYKSDDSAVTNANLSGNYVLFSGCYNV